MSKKGISRRKFLESTGVATIATLISGKTSSATGDDRIVKVKIHPAIGVARIGNSDAEDKEGYFIGPETIHVDPDIKYRDSTGAIKRQAARFRVYGYDEAGNVVRELTGDSSVRITWKVQLANKKASWYRFLAALDIEEAKSMSCTRRNPDVRGSSRKNLEITPKEKSVSGRNSSTVKFDDGRFRGDTVELGEMFTDGRGRLVVLGGKGRAGTPTDAPVFDPRDADTFNNADDWFDDISDGPVKVEVMINGKRIKEENTSQAWLVVAPPNYAPDLVGWRTMYDLLVDTYTVFPGMPKEEVERIPANIRMDVPETTSFAKDVLPLLRRLTRLQWVNKGIFDLHGKGSRFDFEDNQLLSRLADPGQTTHRRAVARLFRLKDGSDSGSKKLQPMFYGDAFGSFDDSPKYSFIVEGLNAVHLKRWADGNFVNDFDPKEKKIVDIESYPLNEQPAILDKSGLYFCLADAFHPGCELTWPMRHPGLYSEPFRIKHRVGEMKDPGERLTIRNAKEKDGPLEAQGPGDLTKWMAVPWHGDTLFCRSGYDPEFDPYLLTYWPSRVPNHVLSEEAYNKIMKDRTLSRSEKLEIFKNREHWVSFMKGSAPDQMHQMIAEFARMGIVEARPGIPNDPDFPAIMYVEILAPGMTRELPPPPPMQESVKAGMPRGMPSRAEEKAMKAGWESLEQLEEFRRIMRRRR